MNLASPNAMRVLRTRIKRGGFRTAISVATVAFVALILTLRILSGVHWITDIIGGALLSTGLVLLYRALGSMR